MSTCHKAQAVTYFAPAGRDSSEELRRSRDVVRAVPLFQATIDTMPGIVLILNGRRQAIGCNQTLCDFLHVDPEEVIGKRPGELVGCANWKAGPDGCGTAENCVTCGAVNAILESQQEHGRVSRECRILLESRQDGGAMDLDVTASAFDANGETYTICCINDISQAKRLGVLARMFFHDVLNTAGAIRGFAEMLADQITASGSTSEELARLGTLTSALIEEIEMQRDLTHAEAGDLETRFEPVQTVEFLQDLRSLYAVHNVANGRIIELRDVWRGCIVTDRRLLGRVLGNMLKNALEATDPGGVVVVRCTDRGAKVAFSVQNSSVMPEDTQLQMFQRSFSTKAKTGRGIGTYSMKLLGEAYLAGRVNFSSQTPAGTVFTLELPKQPVTVDPSDVAAHPTEALRGRVLLAEDAPDNQRLIAFFLSKAGLEVDLADNGRTACQMAFVSESEGKPYDLILMDVQMPELDGLEATRELRRRGWRGPILALTAFAMKGDREKCLAAGCDDYAAKPIDRAALVTMVARHLLTPA
jgi:CheY-like chemotaxis protein